MKISATIITLNEETNIAAAIESVRWADEIVVVDSGSSDRTLGIAESLGAKVLLNEWPGFSAQKQFAVDHAENDWIFSLDADERATEELADEIANIRSAGVTADGYRVARLSFYGSKPIKHGGWYPDLQLRFFDRRKGRWNGAVVHESVAMAHGSRVGRLNGDILHYTIENPAEHERMIKERYAPLGAQKMYAEGRRTSAVNAALAGAFAFVRGYLLKAGFLDGKAGFHIAYFGAWNTFLKHKLLREIQDRVRLE